MAAFSAYLITGGQSEVAAQWRPGESVTAFLRRALASPTSALVVSGARVLDVEFPPDTRPRAVLSAIGGRGERTFGGILSDVLAVMSTATLDRALATLRDKRVIAADEPLSTRRASKDRRWRIADPALRQRLAFVAPALGDVERRRGDLALEHHQRGYAAWRGRAIEPVVRDALWRLLPNTVSRRRAR
ncbi:MAG: hypothetical protein FWG11_00915 [Promicromonosporaceae bacterium]|nr:hypothetical protein [Promicromonosporaceae bacterium]